jgi:hypothetical protein
MTFFQRLFKSAPSPQPPPGCCLGCAHFTNHPQVLESLFQGLSSLSSGVASVRADDGLCHHHGRYLSAWSSCPDLLAVAEIGAATGSPVESVSLDITTPEGRAAALDACPAPDILINCAAFLCSANAGFITGQSLLIDGGQYPGTY